MPALKKPAMVKPAAAKKPVLKKPAAAKPKPETSFPMETMHAETDLGLPIAGGGTGKSPEIHSIDYVANASGGQGALDEPQPDSQHPAEGASRSDYDSNSDTESERTLDLPGVDDLPKRAEAF